MRTAIPLTVLAIALACSLATAPANARARVFVASYGNDANPCTFGSPCKTFQQAVNVVDPGGEVTAIDSAGFGPINITRSVTITSPPGVEAGIVPTSGGNAITINNTSPVTITLRGLTLEGSGVGSAGIYMTSSMTSGNTNTLNIIDCVVKDFTKSGISIVPSNGFIYALITNTYALNNGADGIRLVPSSGGVVAFMITQTTSQGNGNDGIHMESVADTSVTGLIAGSHADYNAANGITGIGNGAGSNLYAQVKDSFAFSNNSTGVLVQNTGISNTPGTEAGFLLANDNISDNGVVDISVSSSTVWTFGNNIFFFTTGTISPTSLH
jgi:hypothetical protein